MKLTNICYYNTDRVSLDELSVENYISTENMLPNKGGVEIASSIPSQGNAISFQENDILISNIRPYFKKIWKANKLGGCSADVLCIRPNEGVDSTFLYYLLGQQSFFDFVMSGCKGCKMPRGDKQHIMQWIINIPDSIEEQHKIASILSSLDDKIELNHRINDNLEQQAQALFKSWFIDFEPFKDGKFVESEMGMIPEGWKIGQLEDVCSIIGGGTPSKARPDFYCSNGIAWITPKDLSNSKSKFTSHGEYDITPEGYSSSSAKLMPRGSVLFSSRAPIGYLSIALNELCTNQGFKSLSPQTAGTCFLYCYLKENTEMIEGQATGSTFKEVSGSLMKSQLVVIPRDNAIFKGFESLVIPIFEKQNKNEAENQILMNIRDYLLPKLMSGELKINEINS